MSVAPAAPALVLSEISIFEVRPRPNACVVDDDVDELVLLVEDDVVALLVMMPVEMPRRASASLLAGPAIMVAVTPALTAIFRPSPPDAKLTVAFPEPPNSALILVVRELSVSP